MNATTGETTQAVGAIRDLWRNGRVLGAAIAHGGQPTLRRRVDRIVRAHVKQNAAFKDLRYSGVRAALASLRQHPRVALSIVGLIYGAAILTAAIVPTPDWAPDVRSGVSDAYRDMLTVNVALLGAQATLLGLVYPLVIALVGVLFEARSTPGGRLQIFFLETEALAAGGMALGFILVVAIEAMSWGVLPQNILVAVTALNVVWFAANLGGLAFFVLRSLQFVQPSRRQDLVRSYVANTAWRSELVRSLLVNRWIGAGVYGDLPPRKDPDDRSWVTVFALDAARVNRRLPQRAQLVDILLGRLVAVLANLGAETDLRFRCFPGDVYTGDTILASADHATLTAMDRWLIRSAFRFGVPQRHIPPTTSELLKEGVADLLGLKAAGRYEEFAKLLSHTIELHALLYGLAQSAELDDGEPVNWGELDKPRLMGGSLCQAWCQAYIELIQSVADQLGPDGRYFDACATLATRLVWRGGGVRASALDPILELPGVAAGALIDGAARRHVEALGAPPTRGQLFITARAGAAYYRRAWINFVGGWESLGEAILQEVKGDDWEVFCQRRSLVQRHLRDTTVLAARAAKAGDRDAIGWTTDMVLKWYGQFSMRRGANPGWALRRSVLTLPLLSRPFAEVQALDIALFNQPADPRQVIDAIFENAWRDSLLVLCSSMIGLMGDGVGPVLIEDGPSRCAAAVFCNESFDPQASNHPQSAPLDAQSVLFSTLRLVGSGERFEPSYNGAMSGLADAIDRLDGPNFVNARIYGWVGMADVQGQALAQAVLLMAAVELRPGRNPAGVALDDSLLSLLVPEADHHRRRLSEHLDQMVIALDRLDPPRGQALVGTLRQSICSPTEYDERTAGARAIIEACRGKIAEVRLAAITSATIDPQRLRAVAQSASGGISKEA